MVAARQLSYSQVGEIWLPVILHSLMRDSSAKGMCAYMQGQKPGISLLCYSRTCKPSWAQKSSAAAQCTRDLKTCWAGARWTRHPTVRCATSRTIARVRRMGTKQRVLPPSSPIPTLPPALWHPASSSPPPATPAVQPKSSNTMAPAQRPSAACITLLRAPCELQRRNWALSAPREAARGSNPTRLPQHRPCLTRLPPSPLHAGWEKTQVLEQAEFEAALLAKVGRRRRRRSCLLPPAAGTASLHCPSCPAGCRLCILVRLTAMLLTHSIMPWAALPLSSGSPALQTCCLSISRALPLTSPIPRPLPSLLCRPPAPCPTSPAAASSPCTG